LPDGEASSYESNDRHPIAPAAPQQRRGPRTEIERWRLVRDGHHEHEHPVRRRGTRACACGRVRGLRRHARPQHPIVADKTISGCSRSVWRQANPSAAICQTAPVALSNECDRCREGLPDGCPLVPLLAEVWTDGIAACVTVAEGCREGKS
jgi:hypothetical protein